MSCLDDALARLGGIAVASTPTGDTFKDIPYDSETLLRMFHIDAEGCKTIEVSTYRQFRAIDERLVRSLMKNTYIQHRETVGLPDRNDIKDLGNDEVSFTYALRVGQVGQIYILMKRRGVVYVYKRVTIKWCSKSLAGVGGAKVSYGVNHVAPKMLAKGEGSYVYKTATIVPYDKEYSCLEKDDAATNANSVYICMEDLMSTPRPYDELFKVFGPIAKGLTGGLFCSLETSTLVKEKKRDKVLEEIEDWEVSCL